MIAASRRRGDLPIDLDLVERIRVNGLPAARFTKDLRSRAGVRTLTVTWIVHRDRIYEIASDSPSSQRASTGRLLIQNSDSFDNLASEDREKIFGHELQVFTSQASEPLARLLDRISSSWSPAVAQVANGLEDLGSVPAGRSVKAPVRVPYRAGR